MPGINAKSSHHRLEVKRRPRDEPYSHKKEEAMIESLIQFNNRRLLKKPHQPLMWVGDGT